MSHDNRADKPADATPAPEETAKAESAWGKLWRLTESNFFWGGGVGVILVAYGFLLSGASRFSVALLVIGWAVITISIYRHKFFEGKSRRTQLIGETLASVGVAVGLAVLWYALRPAPPPGGSRVVQSQPTQPLPSLIQSPTAMPTATPTATPTPQVNLTCQIEKVVIGKGPDMDLAQVFVRLSVRDVGAPSIAEKYKLHIKTGDFESYEGYTDIPDGYTLVPADGTQTLTFGQQDSLVEKTANLIEAGGMKRGWLRFAMQKEAKPDLIWRPGIKYTVSLADTWDKPCSCDFVVPRSAQ